jgi:NADH dehydrogenase (ubiquinone) 1 beta subcomplex subunit 7
MGGLDLAPPKMVATNEEMDAARVPIAYRDYCAHYFIKFQACMRKEFFHWKCHHEELDWENCALTEFVLALIKYSL